MFPFSLSSFYFSSNLEFLCFFFFQMSVCSSAPVGMKIQPLNQTALIVSWERPLTVYHPPITSYMVSYSWPKSDIADEKTFSKIGDQRTVGVVRCLLHVFHFYGCLRCFRHLQHSRSAAMGSVRSWGDMLWWARHVDVGCCHEGQDTPLSLTQLQIRRLKELLLALTLSLIEYIF